MSRSLVAGLVAVAALAILTVAATTGATAGIDLALLEIVRDPGLREPLGALGTVTALGSTEAVAVIAGVTVLIGLATGRARLGALGAASMVLAIIANTVLKNVVARARPELIDAGVAANGFSFPSGHAMLSAVAYGILAIIVWRSTLAGGRRAIGVGGLAVLIVLVGISRVYLGVHFPTDVLGGWIAGGLLVLAFAVVSREEPAARDPSTAAADRGPSDRNIRAWR